MRRSTRNASSTIRETIRTIAEPRARTASAAVTPYGKSASPGFLAVGDVDMRSVMTAGYWTRAGRWPMAWWHVASNGMLQKDG